MRRSSQPRPRVLVLAAVLAPLALTPGCRGPTSADDAAGGQVQSADGWLDALADPRRGQLEAHLRGLDIAMVEIGYRFSELHFAGLDENWAYAGYQAEKIALVLQLAIERRPKRAASAQPFLDEEIPAMLEAIAKEDEIVFFQGLERFRAACMKCHVAEDVPYFTVKLPERRRSPIR